MKCSEKSVILTSLSIQEKENMKNTYETLKEIMVSCGKLNKLVSVSTGEVIEMEEIPRVLGILSGLLDSNAWTLQWVQGGYT